MKLISNWMNKRKDGGHKSPVDAYFVIEIKSLFSIAILKFNKGGRVEYHTHAFSAWTWFITGVLWEQDIDGSWYEYVRKWKAKKTPRNKNHRVLAKQDSWCITIRGPWCETWAEYNPDTNTTTKLTHGRKVVV